MHNLINIFQMNKQAKHLRKNQTDAERLLWNRLRNRQLCNCKFRRQHEIGSYIVDFICLESKLIIELDNVLNAIYQEIVDTPSPQPSPLTTGERE